MNRDDIIRMARESGIDEWWDSGCENWEAFQEHLERFAALVAAAEREACAQLCEDEEDRLGETSGYGCAAAIRARGEK